MMNKIYSKENKKDRFITDHLIPYLIKYIEDSDNPDTVIDSVASMYIFPYITTDGIKIGSLKEDGISWYYVAENDKSIISSGSYRIFAEDILKQEQVKKFKKTFSTGNLITEFSDEAVIKDLIHRMSKEEDYTEIWWTCAYDVFKLWNPEKHNTTMSDATKSISNNYFLFDENYSGSSEKDELIKYEVFRDILTDSARQLFWDKIPSNEKEIAKTVLKMFGVPCSFVAAINKWNGFGFQRTNQINPYITQFALKVGEEIDFPVVSYEKEYSMCNLCHWIFMDIIYKEFADTIKDLLYDDENRYSEGVVVKNVKGEYVPLSWHLFYSEEDFKDEDNEEGEEDECDEDNSHSSILESLHVDLNLYDKSFKNVLKNIHKFSEVNQSADKYGITEEETEEFYKWIWSYSRHAELADIILRYYSGVTEDRNIIEKEANDFVLDVIDFQTDLIEKHHDIASDYAFEIDLQEMYAFAYYDTINKISKYYESIYAVVHSDFKTIDVREYVRQILDSTDESYSVKSAIESDEIWNHVYLVNGTNNICCDGEYLKCKIFKDEYEDVILLWPSTDDDLYVSSLAGYVHDFYNINISGADKIYWKKEYIKMIRGIRAFVSENREIKSAHQIYGYTAEMDDIQDFGMEKRIWNRMKEHRDMIIAQDTEEIPNNLFGGKDFLRSKYKGRCQLCGGKIDMSEQRPYFWTYRMVKERDNSLANIRSNLFCLCPACHGEMQYGSFMGKDMSTIIEKAKMYAMHIEDMISSETLEDYNESLIQELVDDNIEIEGFSKPIVCDVVVNGKQRHMAFSWEHFMRLAFVFATFNDFSEDEIKEMDKLSLALKNSQKNSSMDDGKVWFI